MIYIVTAINVLTTRSGRSDQNRQWHGSCRLSYYTIRDLCSRYTGLDQIVLKKYSFIRIYSNSSAELKKTTSFRLDWTDKRHYIFNFKLQYTRKYGVY